ncbi:MAG: MoaD/ThiS family protein [Pyrinomonadaceae bacterium]|jgi:molybdopterin converting factor small subunit
MSVRILFFGATAEVACTRSQDVDVAEGELASSVFESVLANHPSLAAHKLFFSVNQQFATGGEIIRDGDELAIFTAVSGG